METLQHSWAELAGPVRRFVGRRVADPHAADDIAQDVMLKVQTHLDALPPGEKLAAWVFRVARNAVIDHYRAAAVREHADIADVEPPADEPDEQERVTAELSVCVRRIIEHLPQPYRDALVLADVDGLSQHELADRAGISLSGAKSRVQRARQQLREMITDCCRIETDAQGRVVDYETTERTARYCGPGGPGDAACDR